MQQEVQTWSSAPSASQPVVGANVQGSVDFRARSLELSESHPGLKSGTTFVVAGGHTYIKIQLPGGTTAPPGAKPWIRTVTQTRPAFDWLVLGLPRDPVMSIQTLGANLQSAQLLGSEVVRGVNAAHYRIKVNIPPALVAMGALDCAHASATTAVQTGDVWVDAGGRMVRLRMPYEVSVSAQAVGQAAATSRRSKGFVTTELSQFGVPVMIQVPAAAQTFIDPSEASGPPTSEQGPCQDTATGGATGR